MRLLKRITAGLITVATMASLSVPAFADSWSIDYTQGAPSSISNQFVRREFKWLSSTASVFVTCDVTTGIVELNVSGFSAGYSTATICAPNHFSDFLHGPNPSGCTVEFWARENRVVANGIISS